LTQRQRSGNVDAAFVQKIKELLRVAVPGWSSKEMKYLVILTLLLILRTQMSIWLADVNGKIVKAIVERNFNLFLYRVFNLMLFSVPSSAVNSGMEYFTKLLSVAFRERITEYFHQAYLQKMFYYKICNLDSRIQNPD
jgi:ATP-binding cassette subfamily D (ALD) long-chain fatty acid import protein